MTPGTDVREVLGKFPHQPIDHDNVEFYSGLLRRQLLVNRCRECGHRHVPPRPICPACWAPDPQPTAVSGRGVVYMFTWLHSAAWPGFRLPLPCAIATVELEEQVGLRVSAPVAGIAHADLVVGLAVVVDWLDVDGVPTPMFRSAPSEVA